VHDILLPQHRLTRLRNSYRFPAQAALAARIPFIGRRVPMRDMWRHRSLRRARLAEPLITTAAGAGSLTSAVCSQAARSTVAATRRAATAPAVRRTARAAKHGAARLADASRRAPAAVPPLPRTRLRGLGSVAAAIALGALAMYYLDPHQGRRRRALLRDKAAHARRVLVRNLPRRLERRARFVGGVARGIGHGAAHLVGADGHVPYVDDEQLVARVRSEVLRDPDIKAGEIHIDAYEGCVTLRGQLDREADIRRLVAATKRVEGVRAVRSYLHLPGEPPPNKAEVYEHAAHVLPAI
jgi:hypothetical protein